MAKRRKSMASVGKFRTKTRTVFKKAKSYGKRAVSGISKIVKDLPVVSFGYGLVRNKVADVLNPLFSKMPFKEYNDEIGMALSAYFAGKFIKPMKPIASKIIDNEAYTAGLLTAPRFMGGSSGQTQTSGIYIN